MLSVLFLIWVFLLSFAQSIIFDRLWRNHPGLEAECDGTCRYSMSCWMSGGVVTGSCGGLFQYCCEMPAQARYWGSNAHPSGNLADEPKELLFGPVINEPSCGRPVTSMRRIVGGTEAGFGNFPWQALVRIGSSRCGGALVSSRYVVTAGHCVHSSSPYSIRVYLGEYSLYRKIEPLPRQKFVVISVELHPYYRFTPQADRYDIALLRLSPNVRYMPHISPICLPLRNRVYREGTRAVVAGWGALFPNSPRRPRELQAVDVKTIDGSRCERWHRQRGIKVEIFSDMLCAGHQEGGRDACQGDSGGPLVTKSADGRWYLIGLVSAGYSCAKPGQPGIYHRVSKTADWISYHALYGR